MEFRVLDSVLLEQALIVGRVTDAISGDALPVKPAVTLAWRAPGAADYHVYPMSPHLRRGGYFVFRGAPESFFPTLEAGQSLQCRLTVRARGYQSQESEFALGSAETTPARATERYGYDEFELELSRLDAPVHQLTIALLPEPVSLAGRVIGDNDMESPVTGASVTIATPSGGSAVTDVRGYFRIDALPVVERVTVEIVLDGKSVSKEVLLDYGRRINERIFNFDTE